MRATTRLLQQCRITMFTRDNCSLCTDAKSVLSSVWDRRQFRYEEVNLAKSEAKQWKDLYDFDIPVVSAHATIGAQQDSLKFIVTRMFANSVTPLR